MASPHKLATSKLEQVILRSIRKADKTFSLFKPGDRVIVGCSGGADSFTLIRLLGAPQLPWHKYVEIIPIYVAGGEPGENERIKSIREFSARTGIDILITHREIYPLAFSEKNPFSPCFTCSRLRRKALFEETERLGANKVALAHHRDDIIETLFLNIFFGREISTMLPNQPLFNGKYHIIRPLAFVSESYLKEYAKRHAFPITPYRCPFADQSKRKFIKELLLDLERRFPGTKNNIFLALFHPKQDYLLGKFRKSFQRTPNPESNP